MKKFNPRDFFKQVHSTFDLPQPPDEAWDTFWLNMRSRVFRWYRTYEVAEYHEKRGLIYDVPGAFPNVVNSILYPLAGLGGRPRSFKAAFLFTFYPKGYVRYLAALRADLKRGLASGDQKAVVATLRGVSHSSTQDYLCQWFRWAIGNDLVSEWQAREIMRKTGWRIFGWVSGEEAVELYASHPDLAQGEERTDFSSHLMAQERLRRLRGWLKNLRASLVAAVRGRTIPNR